MAVTQGSDLGCYVCVLQEIEMVISRLEEETASAKEETERAAEARIR